MALQEKIDKLPLSIEYNGIEYFFIHKQWC